MRRGAITCLSILVLLIASQLDTGIASTYAADADGSALASAGPPPGGGEPVGLSGGGSGGSPGGNGGPGNALDSGDDDDYWDGVNNDEEPPRAHQNINLILLILEAWLHTEYWQLP